MAAESQVQHREHHSDRRAANSRRPLLLALTITTTLLVLEVVGGLLTNSLALLADAGHMTTDVAALGLSWFAVWLADRPATPRHSYGFYRAEVLAALLNGATLIAISFYIFWEAFQRLRSTPEVAGGLMLIVAVLGLLGNLASARILMRGGGHQHSLNTRAVFLHVVGDALGSVAAIVAALLILLTGWYLADPILSAVIGLLILYSAWRLVREAVDVLLEATPAGIDAEAVGRAMRTVDGVAGVHDLHIWTVTSGFVSLSAHVELDPGNPRSWHDMLHDLSTLLSACFGIHHLTLQPEEAEAPSDGLAGCTIDSPEGMEACLLPGVVERHEPHVHHHEYEAG